MKAISFKPYQVSKGKVSRLISRETERMPFSKLCLPFFFIRNFEGFPPGKGIYLIKIKMAPVVGAGKEKLCVRVMRN